MGRFKGFGTQALPFFKALAFHQSREWFQENRSIYDNEVVEPMAALLEDLTDRFAAAKVPLRGDAKSIFRIHRDVRFSKDKSPYKTHAGAVMTRRGGKMEPGLLYIHIAADGCFLAAGCHMPEPSLLARLRTAIKDKPKGFESMLATLKKGKLALGMESQLTRLPRCFEEFKDSPLGEAIRLKSFIVEEPLTEAEIAKPKLVERVFGFSERAMPLLEFCWAAAD
ncbi:MAG: TIGR02453 family protein [Bauldia sp.]